MRQDRTGRGGTRCVLSYFLPAQYLSPRGVGGAAVGVEDVVVRLHADGLGVQLNRSGIVASFEFLVALVLELGACRHGVVGVLIQTRLS